MNELKQRFLSLDVFRGMTIFLMIIVNTPGAGARPFAPLLHAEWFGFTVTDLVFPSFLFAVGNALSFSIKKFEQQGDKAFLQKVLKRTVLIFLIGYLMYWFPFFHINADGSWAWNPMSHTRIMGVLQRIALCYGLGALIVRYFSEKQTIIISLILLFGYWALLYIFGEPGQELAKEGNAGTILDHFVFGDNHLYHGGPFEPEGILSTFPAVVNVICGYLAGIFIQWKGKTFETIAKMLMVGVLLLLAAIIWNEVFPIAKKLWTSSFVLYTVGLDLIILACLVYVVEMVGWRRGVYFFDVFGKNPLFIYLLSELLYIMLRTIQATAEYDVFEWIGIEIFQAIIPGAIGSLLFAIVYTLFCWLIGYWLDKKKIYIKI